MPKNQMTGTLIGRQRGDWYSLALTLIELVDSENDVSYRTTLPMDYLKKLKLPKEIAEVIKKMLITSTYAYDWALFGLGMDFA
jgi:hypothetical protein